ncbi:MAG: lytic transglycosylase domain-containing protein [Candidatus Adiutrix sp.]
MAFDDHFEAASKEFNIPKTVAMAIAHVESGQWPWTLNVEGKGFYFDSKNEVLAKAQEALEGQKSFDVGLMQVNSWWLKRFNVPLEAALDPIANIYFGSWILSQELLRHGEMKAAISAYHSPNSARGSIYADKVLAALEKGPQKKEKGKSTSKAKNKLFEVEQTETEQTAMIIQSPTKMLANSASMKVAMSAEQNSMKVSVK